MVSRTQRDAKERASGSDKVPAVNKALAIVRYLNRGASSGVALNEIANNLAITKSHCHNILKTLMSEGWLTYDGERRSYTLAHGLLSDISHLLTRHSPSLLIHDELVRLSLATRLACVLTRVEKDGSFVAIDKAEEAAELIVSAPIGHRFPPDAPAQMRVRLAWMPEEARRQELARWRPKAYTETTLIKKRDVLKEIKETRRRGYSISRAEFSPGVMTLAVPIFDTFGDVQMVLQTPGMVDIVSRNEGKIAAELLRAGGRLNGAFGVSAEPPPKVEILG